MQMNYMQDIPEDFISEMKEVFKLFDKVKFIYKSMILLKLENNVTSDENVQGKGDGEVSSIKNDTVNQL